MQPNVQKWTMVTLPLREANETFVPLGTFNQASPTSSGAGTDEAARGVCEAQKAAPSKVNTKNARSRQEKRRQAGRGREITALLASGMQGIRPQYAHASRRQILPRP